MGGRQFSSYDRTGMRSPLFIPTATPVQLLLEVNVYVCCEITEVSLSTLNAVFGRADNYTVQLHV